MRKLRDLYMKKIVLMSFILTVILISGCGRDKVLEKEVKADPVIPPDCLKVLGIINKNTEDIGTVGYTCKDKNGNEIYTEVVKTDSGKPIK